jgi:hypothetical protein
MDEFGEALARARGLVDEAEKRVAGFSEDRSLSEMDAVRAAVDGIAEKIEEALELLFEMDLPQPGPGREEEGCGPGCSHAPAAKEGEEEAQLPEAAVAHLAEKLAIEQRARMLEAQLQLAAAGKVGPKLAGDARATEEQEVFLKSAVDALEGHLINEANGAIALQLAGILVFMREVKKAKAACALVINAEPPLPQKEEAEKLLDWIDENRLKDKGSCFVATAAMGQEDAPEVVALRAYRDQVLEKSVVGRTLVGTYYLFSPPLARVIARSPLLARAARTLVVRPLARLAAARLTRRGR